MTVDESPSTRTIAKTISFRSQSVATVLRQTLAWLADNVDQDSEIEGADLSRREGDFWQLDLDLMPEIDAVSSPEVELTRPYKPVFVQTTDGTYVRKD